LKKIVMENTHIFWSLMVEDVFVGYD